MLRTIRVTKVLHVFWAIFVSWFLALYLSESDANNPPSPLEVLAGDESLFNIALAAAFLAAPFFTLVALRIYWKPLLATALTLNMLSIMFGASEIIEEMDPSNSMIVLAVGSPLMVVVAASLAIISLISLWTPGQS